jgi:hypothetical protein
MLVSTVFRDREGVKKKAREEKVAGVLAFAFFAAEDLQSVRRQKRSFPSHSDFTTSTT